MNDSSLWRIDLARKIVNYYLDSNNIEAIILAGSTARGCADQYSDIEIGIFWNTAPTSYDRKVPIIKMNGHVWLISDYVENIEDVSKQGGEDTFYIGGKVEQGLKIDILHKSVAAANKAIYEVTETYDTTFEKQELLSAILNSLPLKNALLIETWQSKIKNYPHGLVLAMIKNNLRFNPFFGKNMFTERRHMIVDFNHYLNIYIQRILCTLLGLNKIYHRGDYKWLDEIVDKMSLKPNEIIKRIESIYEVPNLNEKWELLASLIDETCSLVEQNLPEIDTRKARQWFLISRQPWDSTSKIELPDNTSE